MRIPALDDIRAAADRIAGAVVDTPCVPSQTLSGITGCELHCKFENLQFTASFKERGALNRLLTLTDAERARGVVAMSAGNHAQGVAYHARRLGTPATIAMPIGTPFTKVCRTEELGATVLVGGANLSEAFGVAREHAERTGAILIHPFDDPEIIAGQGTVGLEILANVPEPDIVVVPIGGGGLISGIATAIKALSPHTRIIGVQSRTYPSMVNALAGRSIPCPDGLTIAEGIAVKSAGKLTASIVGKLVDELLLVEEATIERAIALLLSIEKTVVEGAGAAGIAAILEHPEKFAGKRVVAPLTGGNIDLRVLASVAMRELVRGEQLMRLSVPISDQPGALSAFSSAVAAEGANVIEVGHDRLSLALNAKGAVLDVVVEVQGAQHGQRLVEALRCSGFDVRELTVA